MFHNIRNASTKNAIELRFNIKSNSYDIIKPDTNIINNKCIVGNGSKWMDFIGFLDSPSWAISQKVKDVFEKNNFNGYTTFPLNIASAPQPYYAFIATSKAGPILNLEDINSYRVEHIEFDLNSWDGSDFFVLEKTWAILCTEKVKSILEKEKFTNLYIKPA